MYKECFCEAGFCLCCPYLLLFHMEQLLRSLFVSCIAVVKTVQYIPLIT